MEEFCVKQGNDVKNAADTSLISRVRTTAGIGQNIACEQALLFGRVKRASRERATERRSGEGLGKGEVATISHKISFGLRPDEGKYHWLKNDVPEIKVL